MQWLAQVSRFYRNSPLSLRVLGYILAISTLFATLVTVVQLYSDYQQDMGNLQNRLADSEKTNFPALIDSLWRFDDSRTLLSMNAMVNLPYVAFATLETPGGEFFKAGELPASDYIQVNNYVLDRDLPDGTTLELGTLSIYVDKSGIYESLLNKLWVILGSQAAKTFAVSVCILLILYFTIMRHLSALAGFAEGLTLMNLGETFDFKRPVNAHSPDELDILAQAINQMRQRLQADLEELDRAQQTTKKLSGAVEASPAAIAIMDEQGRVEFVNQAFSQLTGLSLDVIKGQNWIARLEDMLAQADPIETGLNKRLAQKGEVMFEHLWDSQDGEPKWLYMHLSALRNERGDAEHYLLIMEDITTLKEFEQKLVEHRDYDQLTRLPNRAYAMDEISRRIEQAEKVGSHVAVIAISIGSYRPIAESLGIGYGDLLLRECAEKLVEVVPKDAFVGRGGENKFVVAMLFNNSLNDVENFLKHLRTEFALPIELKDYPVDVNFSAGIAVSPNDGKEAGSLYKNALTAQDRARDKGQRYEFFEEDMGKSSFRRLRIASLLKSLPGSDEMQVHYQPIVNPRTGTYISMESLVRWNSSELGFVSPPEFIGIAEKTGDILQIGEHILTTACRQTKQWHDAGYRIDISVNVSPLQFLDDGFLGVVCNSLETTGLAPEHLKLEITEQLMMESSQKVRNKAEQLTRLGVRLAIDDFGTGYSSLSYLRDIPFSVVKIDQAFIRNMHENKGDQALVKTIIDLAHNFDMEVIAEGVETEQHANMLASYGCDLVQGYYYSKPQPAGQYFSKPRLDLVQNNDL